MSVTVTQTVEADASMGPMARPKTHNNLLGDQAALDRAWEEDGYWFFKSVLDTEAVAKLRGIYVSELDDLGVIDKDRVSEHNVYYNGKSLDGFPYRMEPLMKRSPWREFVETPTISDFFSTLLSDDPFWVPIVEYRATPPVSAKPPSRFDGVHQDGPYSPGIPFRICWIPLATIDDEIGGLCFAEGMTEKINRHPLVNGSNVFIPPKSIPTDRWRKGHYEAGDVLLLNPWTPHSGLKNFSGRFRLSMDHRLMATKKDPCPVVGTIKALTADRLDLNTKSGDVTLRMNEETYVRSHMGVRLYSEDMWNYFKPGTPTIVAFNGDLAVVVRSQQG